MAKLLKGGYIGDHIRGFIGRIKGNTRSLDYSSYGDTRDVSGSTLDGSKGCVCLSQGSSDMQGLIVASNTILNILLLLF